MAKVTGGNPTGKYPKSARRAAREAAIGTEPDSAPKFEARDVGRPRMTVEDLPEDWEKIMLAEAQEGHGPTAFMVKLGIRHTALETLLRDSEKFRNAYEVAFLLSKYWWENQGRKLASGSPGNAAVWSMNMCNRYGWKSTNSNTIVMSKEESNGAFPAPEEQRKNLTREELMKELEARGLPTKLLTD